jgi:hypothetical protein
MMGVTSVASLGALGAIAFGARGESTTSLGEVDDEVEAIAEAGSTEVSACNRLCVIRGGRVAVDAEVELEADAD